MIAKPYQPKPFDINLTGFKLPPDFIFGVCNSPYHSEGGFNTPTGPHNNWSEWEQKGFIEKSGETNRFWVDWQPHIQKAAEIGLDVFRMGFAWERVQPSSSTKEAPEPEWDESAFDRYAEIVGAVYEAGMEPCITLHHFTHPAWIGPWLWKQDEKVEKFLDYIRRAVTEINQRLVSNGHPAIRQYVVFNEPYNTLAGPYLFGDAPPGTVKNDVAGFGEATMNLIYAYIKTYDIIYDIYEANGWRQPHVAYNIVSYCLYEQDKWYVDLLRAPERGIERDAVMDYLDERRDRYYAFMRPVGQDRLNDRQMAYWDKMAAQYEQMYLGFSYEKVIDALYESPRCKKLDYLAVDCYDPFIFVTLGVEGEDQPPEEKPIGGDRFDWTKLTFNPDVTREHLRMHSQDRGDIPLYILETTIGHNHEKFGVPEPRPDGITVEVFLKAILAEVVRLIQEGVPLMGFLYWTLCDNYEWGTYTSRLGLAEYDYERHVIKNTDAFGAPNLKIYKTLIAAMRSGDADQIRAAFQPVEEK